MKVLVGDPIPFWFRLWDGNPSAFVLAHVTDSGGNEVSGSPYPLSYVQRGIYAGLGPQMPDSLRVVDYEVYLDSGFTELDNAYLPASEWVEPDMSSQPSVEVVTIGTPIKGKVLAPVFKGLVTAEPDARARIQSTGLLGFISTPKFTGFVSAVSLEESL